MAGSCMEDMEQPIRGKQQNFLFNQFYLRYQWDDEGGEEQIVNRKYGEYKRP